MYLDFILKHGSDLLLNTVTMTNLFAPYYLFVIFFLLYFYNFFPSKKLIWSTFFIFYFLPLLFIFFFFFTPFLKWILTAHDANSSFVLTALFSGYFFCASIAYLEICENYEKEIKEDYPEEFSEELNLWGPYPKDYLDFVYMYGFSLFVVVFFSGPAMWVLTSVCKPSYVNLSTRQFLFIPAKLKGYAGTFLIFPEIHNLKKINHLELIFYLCFLILFGLFLFYIFYKIGSKFLGDKPLFSEKEQELLYKNYFHFFIPVLILISVLWSIYWYTNENFVMHQSFIFLPFTGVEYHFDINGIKGPE